MLKKIKRFIPRGFSIRLGPYAIELKIGRPVKELENSTGLLPALDLRQAAYLRAKYAKLENMAIVANERNAGDVLRFYFDVIPAIDDIAGEVCIRNALDRLKNRTSDPELKTLATREIARSDLRSGIPDRARILVDDEIHKAELELQLLLSDQAYGAKLLAQEWPGISRGQTLCHYFNAHEELVRGKRILHFSPEPELRGWITERAESLNISYETSNIVGDDVDMNQDITVMTVGKRYDLIVCHRVLEHVMDDAAAFRELYRILAPGGVLQISVPQSMHQPFTKEWTVPDETHHEHVRQYGRDFSTRLEMAGFSIVEVRWLMERQREELLASGAYPLRMYHAYKQE